MKPLMVVLWLLVAVPALAQAQVPAFLAGQWVQMSSGGTYTGGGYSSQRSITLYANGTYEYYGESSNSGGNGDVGGASRDTGRWHVVGNVTAAKLVAVNQAGQTFTFELELRNHPKTHDPMIVLDGTAFVTATPRDPWPDL